MSGKLFVEDDFGRSLCVVFVMGAWDDFSELGEVINYDQQSRVARGSLAKFQVVELHQVVEIAAVYVLQGIARVSCWVFGLLACQASLDVV